MNWQQLCADPALQNLPYKMELNQQGQIIMSPASVRYILLQARIIALLNQLCPDLIAVPEFPVETSNGVKVIDVGLLTAEQAALLKNNVTSAFAPLLCVEVLSPSKTLAEMNHKKKLYFNKGAEEFWLCDAQGTMTFYNKNGELSSSELAVQFPANLDL